MPAKNFDDYLSKTLREDSAFASEYLNQALADSEHAFLVALRKVSQANGGLTKLAGKTRIGRQSLYRMFSHGGNPTVSSLLTVLAGLGLSLTVSPYKKRTRRNKVRQKIAA